MGLFGFLKRQLLKVIQMEDMPANVLVKKYELTDRDEIMNSSSVVVRPGQAAVFVHKGQICDVFSEGTYKLSSENIPVLTKVLALPTGFESPIKADIYYVNVRQITGLKWGTQNPVMMRDKEFGNVRVRGFGVYAFQITDPKTFMREVSGVSACEVNGIDGQLRPMIIEALADTIAESKISALDLATNYREFSSEVMKSAEHAMSKFGVKITSVVIENISLPEEVEKALDERTKLGILKDEMGTYTQYQAANALRDAAQNESGGNLAGLGVGLGAGTTIGGVFANALSNQQQNNQAPAGKVQLGNETVAVEQFVCHSCGMKLDKKEKFCPECGAKLVKVCGNCGHELTARQKFCPECGTPTAKMCPKCKKVLANNAKFCPECGEKV